MCTFWQGNGPTDSMFSPPIARPARYVGNLFRKYIHLEVRFCSNRVLPTPAPTPLRRAANDFSRSNVPCAVFEVCSVCSTGYGRGAANQCHSCSEGFKGGMIFILSVGVLLTLVVLALLAVYLVRSCYSVICAILVFVICGWYPIVRLRCLWMAKFHRLYSSASLFFVLFFFLHNARPTRPRE